MRSVDLSWLCAHGVGVVPWGVAGGWGGSRDGAVQQVLGEPDSRAATDALLGVLRRGRFGPRAWWAFTAATSARSAVQAARHRRPLVEAVALHLLLGLLARPRRRLWVASSGAYVLLHLGMLEGRRSLGVPNALTIVRANLPALVERVGPAMVLVALLTDVADGRLSRGTGWQTRFGAQADFLADTAFWTHHVAAPGTPRVLRVASLAAWAVPVAAVTATSVARGRMVDVPRRPWFRPAMTAQLVLGADVLLDAIRSAARRRPRPGSS